MKTRKEKQKMPETKYTYKEKVWEALSGMKIGDIISMVSLAKDIGCTLAHLSVLLRSAKECGYLNIHDEGDYAKSKQELPLDYAVFKEEINRKIKESRASATPRATPKSHGFSKLPAKIEISEENILSVLARVFQEKKELEKKNKALTKYAKKLRKREKKLLEGINEML